MDNRGGACRSSATGEQADLRQAVAGPEAAGPKSVACERVRKALERTRSGRLRPHADHSQGRQVELLALLVSSASRAQLEGEVRCTSIGCSVLGNGLQPAGWTPQKRRRRHVDAVLA